MKSNLKIPKKKTHPVENLIRYTPMSTPWDILENFSAKASDECGGKRSLRGMKHKTTGKVLILSLKICNEYENSMNEIRKGWHT